MRIRSFDQLDLRLAWQRVLNWAQGGSLDLPDRLPFEVMARLYGEAGPPLRHEHHLAPVTLVMSSKKSGTTRPFVRLDPVDVLLYQALVDALAEDIERSLPSRDKVFAYRQALDGEPHAFSGAPSRAAFETRVQEIFGLAWSPPYAITADIAGYFLHISIEELGHSLYGASSKTEVIRDLLDLLRAWQTLGIRGLPQGVWASRPLGNLYLGPVDRLLAENQINYVRWMDDWVIAAAGYHAAREIQDQVERRLYDLGLTLASDKTRVVRAATAVAQSVTAKESLARIKRARKEALEEMLAEVQSLSDYPIDDADLPDLEELDRNVVVETYDQLLEAVEDDDLPPGFRPMVTEVMRDLSSLRVPYALDQLPRLLERAPDLTGSAATYLASLRPGALPEVTAVFAELLAANRFVREHEKLKLCQGVLALPQRQAGELAEPLAAWALEDGNPLVRARALLAWGAQSREDDFSVVDRFWVRATTPWRLYALVAIQGKSRSSRDRRLDRWSGEGRFLGEIANALRMGPFGWRKL